MGAVGLNLSHCVIGFLVFLTAFDIFPCPLTGTIIGFGVLYFILAGITAGMSIASGLVVPMLTIGQLCIVMATSMK